MSDILTEEYLCALADAWHKRGLLAWLDKNRIPYVIAASGWPRVHRLLAGLVDARLDVKARDQGA